MNKNSKLSFSKDQVFLGNFDKKNLIIIEILQLFSIEIYKISNDSAVA